MNKILSSFMLVIACVCMVSCSDNSNDWYESSDNFVLSLEKSDILFDAPATQGSIEVNCDGDLTATSSEKWCKVSVEGKKVNVSVEDNLNLEGRSAVINLTCGDRKTKATVQQKGFVFVLDAPIELLLADKKQTLSYSVNSQFPVEVSSEGDWFTAEYKDGEIIVNVDENATSGVRSGSYTVKCLNTVKTFQMTQGELKDILGDYYFAGYDEGKLGYVDATISGTAPNLEMSMQLTPTTILTLPLTFDAKTLSVSVPFGYYMGDYAQYKMISVALDTVEGYLTWSSDVSISGPFYGDEGETVCDLLDNGSWENYTVDSFLFEAFSAAKPTSSTRLGTLIEYDEPFLLKKSALGAKSLKAKKNYLVLANKTPKMKYMFK